MNTDLTKILRGCMVGSVLGLIISVTIYGHSWQVSATAGAVIAGLLPIVIHNRRFAALSERETTFLDW